MTEINPLVASVQGPAPAWEIAKDMAKRGIWIAPVLIAIGGFWGVHGAISSAYAVVIVVANFLFAAWLLATTGRISFALMAGAALFGYLARLAVLLIAFLVVKDASWLEKVPFGITLIVTHLGLLFWELKYISGSFAFPGLKPTPLSHQGDMVSAR